MLKVSLIVATLGERPTELHAFLESLLPQVEFIANVIVVDQNRDADVVPSILSPFRDLLPIQHTRSQPGLSRARNRGLAYAGKGLVAFPDDDCVYPEGLLSWVVNWFENQVEYDILAVGVKDAQGVPSGNRWPQHSCDIRPFNALRTTFSSSLFMWSDLAKTARFDTNLGVGAGTPFGSGEETDYVLRLLRARARGRFDRTWYIVHPRRDMLSGGSSAHRAQTYGFGMGHLLRRHTLRNLWVSCMLYNLARAAFAFISGNTSGAKLCLAQTRGMWAGFRSPYTPSPVLLLDTATARNRTRSNETAERGNDLMQVTDTAVLS